MSGRVHRETLVAGFASDGDSGPRLLSPGVGLYRGAPRGRLMRPGDAVGELEVLGELFTVVAPKGAHGLARDPDGGALARRPVGHGDTLVCLDTDVAARDAATSEDSAAIAAGTVFCSPTSGRYYSRPAPDAAPFVAVGDVVSTGQTVALLEVMKTFNRLRYGDPSLPERATVLRVFPENEADLAAGDVILELDPLD